MNNHLNPVFKEILDTHCPGMKNLKPIEKVEDDYWDDYKNWLKKLKKESER